MTSPGGVGSIELEIKSYTLQRPALSGLVAIIRLPAVNHADVASEKDRSFSAQRNLLEVGSYRATADRETRAARKKLRGVRRSGMFP